MASGPTIDQLRKATQDRPDKHDFYMWGVARKISVYFTWLFVRTSIKPNWITALGIIFGFVGCIMFTYANPIFWVFGWIIANMYFILDQVDGEVARYKNMVTKFGYFFDEISHPILNNTLFFAASFGLFTYSGNVLVLLFGITALFFLSLLRFVGTYSDFVTKNMFKLSSEKIEMPKNWLKRLASIPLGLGGYFHIFLVAAILDIFLPLEMNYGQFFISGFRELFLIILTAAIPIVAIWKIISLRKTLKDSRL